MSRLSRSPALILLASLVLAACASTPPPPPPPPGGTGALRDWRGIVTASDRDRYSRRDAAWSLALQQARRQAGSGDLTGLGDLIEPRAARSPVAPPPGDYRCRTVKLGSQGGEDGLGYVVYGWFACRIEQTPNGLKFSKLTGSQRPGGLLFPENDRQMVMLGSMALAAEPPANSYGQRPDRDLIAVLERIGDRRWRLVIPWPQAESNLDLIELVPA
ncbi:MAG: DUF4893 domain-containing protein [Alphaproteobacteria bacterium]|uniref:DUF4893 domain-containing protein n=1 Tax=Brevundimonas sp. TaxID=1871086 RepID=UPI0017DE4A2E|nr:DUF4893 domain-containing protein [Brevundimonas sp.]MBA3050248.1 DUF4893 domain-containing protein [Brevundimonas sp.]MBU3974245.1 DUF4893 domain-containing protein [Alphaproteobacteria bacterium]MBU4040097.1 DUF4893 domain-containing protein [Alphaproteobacteria bacterium]MBU4138124.1 DUF4893 domain-containing protein [Alphaproteobacteria bacterium]